jgi:uncharacterized LabA/DUF88 family protein
LSPHDRLNIAVFIDFDNIEIGVKSTLGQQFDVGAILDAIKERGEVVTKIAYADWTRAGEYSRSLTQHAIRLVQRNLTPGGDKNGADINLALDALEMVFTHQHINAYVIVGGDSDFLSLVEKLKQYDKKVFVVGGRAFTSVILQRNCHEFIAYENLSGVRKQAIRSGRPMPTPGLLPIAQAVPSLRRALKILADREVSPQTGLLKSTLLQLDSTFSERTYGASSFLDFVEKLAQAGLVQLKHAGRSVMVELVDGGGTSAEQKVAVPSEPEVGDEAETPTQEPVDEPPGPIVHEDAAQPFFRPAGPPAIVQATESQADGVKRVGEILKAATNARWPMYLRNVKQLLRAAEGGFDERRYGFGGLVDLVRACQKDGWVRLERDRRGGLRVFPGTALPRAGFVRDTPPEHVHSSQVHEAHRDSQPAGFQPESVEVEPGNALDPRDAVGTVDAEIIDTEPMPTIDPTAELLGTSTRRKRPTRTTTGSGGRGTRAAAPRKPLVKKAAAPRRPGRAKSSSNTET